MPTTTADIDQAAINTIRFLAIEGGITRGWHAYTEHTGAVIGLDRFGLSGPGDEVYAALGFTIDRVVDRARTLL